MVSALLQLALCFHTHMWLVVVEAANVFVVQPHHWLGVALLHLAITPAIQTCWNAEDVAAVWHVAAASGRSAMLTCCALVSCLLLLPPLSACTSLLQVQQQQPCAA